MNLKDIIDLAKQGYKPSDIRELFALSQEQEQEQEQERDQEQEHEQEQEQEQEQEKNQEHKKEKEQEQEQEQEKETEKDRIINELRKKLKNENLSDGEKFQTSTDILNSLLKNM